LNGNIKEIRLVALQPCPDPTAAIECKILNAILYDRPHYEALSYMWGDEADPQTIKIEGKAYQIRQNLWLALNQLRLAEEERILWVDAVCINQDNIAERNHQVGFMSSIYRQAHCVIAWLGPETETSHHAMSFLNQIYEGSVPVAECDSLRFKEKWAAIKNLCEMPYWGRLWIIQEVVLASDVVLCCGKDTLPGEVFIKIRDLLAAYGKYRTWNPDTAQEFLHLQPVRLSQHRNRIESSDHTLVDILFEFGEAVCQDPRDKIFGLFFLSKQCCKAQVFVDYSKTAFEICNDAISHYLDEHLEEHLEALFPLAADFTQPVMLADIVHRICEKGYSLPDVIEVGVLPTRFQRLLGAIIYTTPLEALDKETETVRRPRWSPYLHVNELQYLQSVWNYLGHPPLGQDPDVRSIIAGKMKVDWGGGSRLELGSAKRLGAATYPTNPYYGNTFANKLKSSVIFNRWAWVLRETSNSRMSLSRERNTAVTAGTDVIVEDNGQFQRSDISSSANLAASWAGLVKGDKWGTLAGYARKLIHTVRNHPYRYLPESQIKIFVDNNGVIGLAPNEVLPGDTIWEVDGPDPLVIARKTAEGYKTITWSTTKPLALSELEDTNWFESLSHCHLTFVTLPDEQ
jgi:hypothetical protein